MRRFPTSTLLIFLYLLPHSSGLREEEMVSSWAQALGDELWELGTIVTKSPEIRTSYIKLNARVLATDGEGMLKTIVSNVGKLLKRKMTSVLCLAKNAEWLSEEEANEESLTNYTYYNSIYSPRLVDGELVTDDEVEEEMETQFFREMELQEENDFYQIPVNITYSSVYIPLDVYDREIEVVSPLYWSEGLDETFKKNYLSDSSVSWQYFCSSSGFLRHYPAAEWFVDDFTFDCRSRLWYVEAASCPKDIIMFVDHSGSMDDVKKTIAKFTVKTILRTLSNNDFINIFVFSETIDKIVSCFPSDALVQATPDNLAMFSDAISDIVAPSNKTDIKGAFNFASKLLQKAKKAKACPDNQCNQAVFIITDGVSDNITDIFMKYSLEANNSIPFKVFIFAVGRGASNLEDGKLVACKSKGFFSHVKYVQEVRREVLKYPGQMSRGREGEGALVTWSELLVDPTVGDLADMGSVILVEEAPMVCRPCPQQPQPQNLRMIISVSTPAYQPQRDKDRARNLLGVAGLDILVRDIQKLSLPYKIGANGYAFLVTNNGFVIFHPDLRPVERGVIKLNYNSVDLTEVELYDDDESEPRKPNEQVLKLRESMVFQREGSMLDMKMKFHYSNMNRIGTETRNYYFAPLKNTPFSLGLALPYSYGSYWIKAGDEIKKSKQMGIPLTDHFRGNWRVHPDWTYCDYLKTSIEFESQEEKLSHFLEKIFESHDWKWKEDILSAQDSQENDEFDPGRCDKEPIREGEYYCDKDLMQLLVFDAKVTENSYKDKQWSAKNRREEEVALKFGVTVRFVATQSGLTRWQHIPGPPAPNQSFGDMYHRSLEEDWYKSAVLFHQIDPDAFVFTVPLGEGRHAEPQVTASFAIFPRDGGNEAPGSVVGLHLLHSTLNNRFIDITSKTKCRECMETCGSDSLDCYVIDNNGYIVLSEVANDTGRFFGEREGAVMEAMVVKNIFRRIPVFDYQGLCCQCSQQRSAVDIIKTPFLLAKQFLFWIIGQMFWLMADTSYWMPVMAQHIPEPEIKVKGAGKWNLTYEPCDKAGHLFLLQPKSAELAQPPSTGNCSRPFYAQRVPRTNLLLIVVNTLYQSCYRNYSANIETIEYGNMQSQEPACQRVELNQLPRRRPNPCPPLDLDETWTTCGAYILSPANVMIIVICIIFLRNNLDYLYVNQ